MENMHKRKKQPEVVKKNLIENAVKIAIKNGFNAVTVQSVSEASGVTKGAFMYHFASKKALIDKAFQDLIEQFNAKIENFIEQDEIAYGSFTRAYLKASIYNESNRERQLKTALFYFMFAEPEYRQIWKNWFEEKITTYNQTDSGDFLVLIRLAVDGFWIKDLANDNTSEKTKFLERLIAFTYPAK